MAEQGHFWQYSRAEDRWVCSRCTAATYDTLAYNDDCVKSKEQQDKDAFVTALDNMTKNAYLTLRAWQDSDRIDYLLNSNADLLKVYERVFTMSFDEWYHELTQFKSMAERVVKYDLETGDCVNCIHGNNNLHHKRKDHDAANRYICVREGCDCLSFTSLSMSEA